MEAREGWWWIWMDGEGGWFGLWIGGCASGSGLGGRTDGERDATQVCSSYFVDRMDWMGEMDANEGKIACPKCKGKVGKYFWSGVQCSCGAWITPAIQVAKAKVDPKVLRSGA